jgi:hypothetical protein
MQRRRLGRLRTSSCAALTLVLSACNTAAAPSKSDYIARANRTCADTQQAIKKLESSQPGTFAAFEDQQRKINAVERSALAVLEKLPRPQGSSAELSRQFNDLRRALDAGNQSLAESAKNNTAAASQALQRSRDYLRMANDAADSYGMHDCAL